MVDDSSLDTPFPEWVLWLLPVGGLVILLAFFAFSGNAEAPGLPVRGRLPAGTVLDAVTRRPLTPAFQKADKEFRMGEVFRQRRKFAEATTFYRDALRLDPNHLDAQDRLGYCLWKQRNLPGATEAFGKALDIDSGFYRSHFYLGRIHRETGEWKAALTSHAKAWNQSPKRDFVVGFEYAQLLFQLGMYPEALDVLGELRTRFPSNPQGESLRVKVMEAQNRL